MNNSINAYYNLVDSGRQLTWHERIMEYFQKYGAGTKEMIARILNCEQEQIHKRLHELEEKQLIKRTPYSMRASSTGQNQTIWARFDKSEIKMKV